jgi:hypothetical protein
MYQVGLVCRYHLTNDCKTILDDYSWWISIVRRFCKIADYFEIRCWAGETEAIETGIRYGNPVKNSSTDELVFKGSITDEFEKEITSLYFNKDNCLKWFTLIIYKDETILFLSEHYGSEIHLLNITEDDIKSVKSRVELYSILEIQHIYEMNDNIE